jgi:hypothetical protein
MKSYKIVENCRAVLRKNIRHLMDRGILFGEEECCIYKKFTVF